MQSGMAKEVSEQIRSTILENHMAPGEKLPTEGDLVKRYSVSRSTVREAMKILQAENVVEIRHGLGSFVANNTGISRDPLGLVFAEQSHLLEELMEVRLLLEPGIAGLAAARRSDEDLDRIAKSVRDMRSHAESGSEYEQDDYQFHISIAESTHNSVLQRVFPVIFEAIEKGYEKTAHNRGSLERAIMFHDEILHAIRDQDELEARRLSRQHIEQALKDIIDTKEGASL